MPSVLLERKHNVAIVTLNNPTQYNALAATLEMETTLQSQAFTTSGLREGAAAFVEKRAPVFIGA